MRQTFSSQG